ncbi:MAG: gamma-glutamyl-gamma-aminobutyrate hydrolase family protein [Actinomycetota bacterium]|nr:gamma-glutamyl-gamma-aminobutyrate hydrolase family protein [Actinomycetota bacterium]
MTGRRPLVAIPGRRSSAEALRFGGVVVAEQLAAAVLDAGGEPVVLVPERDPDAADRLAFADAVLLPGGGDVDPSAYGARDAHESVYGVDAVCDSFDLAVARHAVAAGVPLLAICRGLQVLDVALGGTLSQHLDPPHRDGETTVHVSPGSSLETTLGTGVLRVSCFHHQHVETLGAGLVVVATAQDGTVEALELPGSRALVRAVQWHPEDTFEQDASERALFAELVDAATARRTRARPGDPDGGATT